MRISCITLWLLFYGLSLFAQPANDNCSGARTVNLSTPPDCPDNSPVTDNINGSNVTATATSPFPVFAACATGGQVQGPAAEVWYTFIATGDRTDIQITGGLPNPKLVLFKGNNCSSLIPIECVIGGSGVTLFGTTIPGEQYYLMVSGVDLDDRGTFTLRFSSSQNCNVCYQSGAVTLAYNPPPLNGTYASGQMVQICATVNYWFSDPENTIEWLHSMVFEFGESWDLASIAPAPVPSCDGRGSWDWYESWTSCNTGQTFGPGFAYDSSWGVECGGEINDGDPGNNWGDGPGSCGFIPEQSPPVTFCFSIKVKSNGNNDCPPGTVGGDLGIWAQMFSDGDSGSWPYIGCSSNQGTSALGAVFCCADSAPLIATVNASCTGAPNGAMTISGNGGLDSTQRFNYSLLLEDSVVVYECINCPATITTPSTLAAGNYTVLVNNATTNCGHCTFVAIQTTPAPSTVLSATLCTGTSYVFQGDTLTEAGVYWDTLTAASGCDSLLSLDLSFVDFFSMPLEASICEGESYAFAGQMLQLSGTYTDTLTALGGCDSIQVLTLEVKEQPSTLLMAAICAGDTLFFDNDTLTTAGDYTYTYPAANGCDSLVSLELRVLDNPLTFFTVSICEGESYTFDGQQLTQSGTYSALYPAANGCDSLVSLELAVLDNPLTSLTESICEGESYTFDGQPLSQSGAYSALYTAANGCDSLVTLELAVLDNPLTLFTESICEGSSYTFDGQELTEAGAYSALYTAANGCDSLVTLELSVLLFGDSTHLSEVICAGESYDFQGNVLSESGQYEAVLPAANGCDSLVTLALSVLPTYHTTLNESICEGYSFSYHGEELFEAGVYTYTFTAANGCDSTVTLNLEVLPLANSLYLVQQCVGTSYFFDGQDLTEAGIYTASGIGANGCDSLATLELSFVTESVTTTSASICAGESYSFQGQSLTEAGLYTDTLTGTGGCDSILLLQLSVLPLAQSSLNLATCHPVVVFNGEMFTTSGTYTFLLPGEAANGCDSLVVLNLSFVQLPTTFVFADICLGETYDFNGVSINDPGQYPFTLQSSGGCDSLVVLSLTVSVINTGITLSNNVLEVQAANATYQWINCNGNEPIPGATSSTYAPEATGLYAVVVMQDECTATSVCTEVLVVSTATILPAEAQWQLQPNPAQNRVSLVFESATSTEFDLSIYDAIGRLLSRHSLAPATERIDLDLSAWPDGIFFVRLAHQSEVSTKRLLKAAH